MTKERARGTNSRTTINRLRFFLFSKQQCTGFLITLHSPLQDSTRVLHTPHDTIHYVIPQHTKTPKHNTQHNTTNSAFHASLTQAVLPSCIELALGRVLCLVLFCLVLLCLVLLCHAPRVGSAATQEENK